MVVCDDVRHHKSGSDGWRHGIDHRDVDEGSSVSLDAFEPFIQAASAKYGIRPELIRAQIMHESAGDPNCIGDNGNAIGLLQIHKAAAFEMGFSWNDLKDPAKNIDCGVGYLAKQMKAMGGNEEWALAAFNQGPTVIGRAKHYADAILATAK